MTGRERTLLERLASLETGQLSDVLDEAGMPNTVLSSALKPVGRATRVAGIAVCARGEPIVRMQRPRRLPETDALDRTITPGCVLLIETGGYVAGSCVGGLMAFSFKRSGCCGLIVDGAVRDAAEIEELGLATWSRELTPVNGSRRWSLVEIGRPIRMPGQGGSPVEVAPGDYVVGDVDGVVIVPAAVAESIVADAEELARIERKIADELRAGGSRGEVFQRNPRFAHIRAAI